jgi:hypothetical protein
MDTGALFVYGPLIVGPGETAVPPTVPNLPANNIVGCWFGSNLGGFTNIAEETAGGLNNVNCVHGNPNVPGDMFGQFAACNAKEFFAAANTLIASGKLNVPQPGTGTNGRACYTARSYEIVDQDPNDNVITKFFSIPNGGTTLLAQNNAGNKAAYPNGTLIANGSDEGLLTNFYAVNLGCKPYLVQDLADPTGAKMIGSLALNELQSAETVKANPNSVWASIPPQDPMVLTADGNVDIAKQNTFRAAVNQPPTAGGNQEEVQFCQNILSITAPALITDLPFTFGKTSPSPPDAIDMFTFVGQRFAGSFALLNCKTLLNIQQDPVTANRDANGVAISIIFNTPALQTLLQQFLPQFPQAANEALGGNGQLSTFHPQPYFQP